MAGCECIGTSPSALHRDQPGNGAGRLAVVVEPNPKLALDDIQLLVETREALRHLAEEGLVDGAANLQHCKDQMQDEQETQMPVTSWIMLQQMMTARCTDGNAGLPLAPCNRTCWSASSTLFLRALLVSAKLSVVGPECISAGSQGASNAVGPA